jgi:hypothetical protein
MKLGLCQRFLLTYNRKIVFINLNIEIMKNSLIVLSLSLLLFISCKKEDKITVETISTYYLSMGSSYANDIYYKLDSGIVAYVPRTNWDIAFHTSTMSSTIITNGGNGVELYAYPKGDTAKWNAIDTSGIKKWKILYNSDTTWTYGAFERNSLGHPDYGWGVYNSINHDIIGDSLFIIKLANSQYKKLWIKKKLSTQNKYSLVYANLDGSSAVSSIIDCSPYTAKNFVYYSLASNAVIDREPASADWDLLITKYIEMIPSGSSYTPYPVMGILSNTMRLSNMGTISYSGIRVAQMDGVDINSDDYTQALFQTSISTIGSDWKTFSQTTYNYTLKDNLAYYVETTDKKIYKIVFTKFLGSSTGSLEFVVKKVK